MSENELPLSNDELEIQLIKYENLQAGRANSFLEAEDFEDIIHHFEEEEQYNKALEAVTAGLSQYPFHSGLQIDKANILLLLNEFEAALEVLNSIPDDDNFDTNITLMKIEAFLALSDEASSNELFREALQLPGADEVIEMFFELADVFDGYEDFEKVYDCLAHILELEGDNEEALYKICFWTDYTGRYEESIELHKAIIEDFPFSELAWFNLGTAYQGLKLHEKAIDAYQYSLAIDDSLEFAYRNIGDAYLRLRKYDLAIESLIKLSEITTPEAVVFEAIGHCYDKKKEYQTARNYYKKASQLHTEDSTLVYKIGLTYMNESNWKTAVEFLLVACKMAKLQPDYHFALGQCYVKLENFTEAITHLGSVIRTRPKNRNAWTELLNCLYKAHMFDDGYNYSQFAWEQTDGKPIFLYYKALFLHALGSFKEAVNVLNTAMVQEPKHIKKFIEINPTLLQHKSILDVIARNKRKKRS